MFESVILSKWFDDDFRKEYDKIYDNKKDLTSDKMQNQKIYEKIFKDYFELLENNKFNETIITSVVKETTLEFRDYAKEFLKKMYELNIPVIIISCSPKNVVKEVLKHNNMNYKNIEVYGNCFDFTENKKHIYNITPYNKNEIVFSDELNKKIANRKYALMIGDNIGDTSMVSQVMLPNTITIGFLDKDIDAKLEQYNSTFDIVLTDNAGFKDILDIINL